MKKEYFREILKINSDTIDCNWGHLPPTYHRTHVIKHIDIVHSMKTGFYSDEIITFKL